MDGRVSSIRWWLVALALVAVLLAGQALASASAPTGSVTSTGRVIGQTGFAYLGGLRTFAAAVLWNRLEPIFHNYYDGRDLSDLPEFLPTMRLVQTLDPQFEQSYYNAAWFLYRRGRMDEALRIAREGIENNPRSGLLHANYVQMLLIDDKVGNIKTAYKSAAIGVGPTAEWMNADDKFEGYGIFRTVFRLVGDQATVEKINEIQAALRAQGAQPGRDDE